MAAQQERAAGAATEERTGASSLLREVAEVVVLAVSFGMNVIHGSDSVESAAREVDLFFDDSELVAWERTIEPWVIE